MSSGWGGVCIEKQGDTLCCCTLGTQLLLRGGKREREDNAGGQCRARKGRARAGHPPPPSVEMPLPLPVAFVTPRYPGQDVRSKLSRQFREVLKTAQTIQGSFEGPPSLPPSLEIAPPFPLPVAFVKTYSKHRSTVLSWQRCEFKIFQTNPRSVNKCAHCAQH